jgi:hypothetical protein
MERKTHFNFWDVVIAALALPDRGLFERLGCPK